MHVNNYTSSPPLPVKPHSAALSTTKHVYIALATKITTLHANYRPFPPFCRNKLRGFLLMLVKSRGLHVHVRAPHVSYLHRCWVVTACLLLLLYHCRTSRHFSSGICYILVFFYFLCFFCRCKRVKSWENGTAPVTPSHLLPPEYSWYSCVFCHQYCRNLSTLSTVIKQTSYKMNWAMLSSKQH